MDEQQERLLVVRSQHGDVAAFNTLVEEYQRDVFTYISRLLNNPQDAADNTQQAFLSAFQHISTFRRECSFRSWLFRIANNCVYDHWRKEKRHAASSLEQTLEQDISPPALIDASPFQPEHLSLSHEVWKLLEEGLQSLPFDQRQAVLLCDVHGYSYEDIALITSTQLGTVRSRIARGRASLRTFLLQYPELLPDIFRPISREGENI